MSRRPLVLVCALVALAALPATASAQKVGISDQTPQTFDSPFFPQLKSTVARYIAPYDVMSDPVQLEKLRLWVAGAQRQRQKVLVHFEHSRKSITLGGRAPTAKAYEKAMRAFKAAFPTVREIGVWNEANRKRDNRRGVGQPTAGKPKLLAAYYKAARKVFKGSRYRIVALDVLDENNVAPAVKLVSQFQSRIGKQLTKSMVLGFHNYSDTNRFSTKRTKAVLRAFKGKEVWLTETGGLVQFGTNFPYDEGRATRAINCMFALAKSNRRIKRLYIYNYNAPFNANDVFDAGLVGKDGRPRPGFNAVVTRTARGCRS